MMIYNRLRKVALFTACFSATVFLFSCKSRHRETSSFFETTKFDEDDFAEVLAAKYQNVTIDDTAWAKEKMHKPSEIVHYVYYHSEYLPLWINENGSTPLADKLVDELESLMADGLNPERYKLSQLKQQLAQLKKEGEPEMDKIIATDTALTYAYVNASHDLLLGVLKPADADKEWYHDNDTIWTPETSMISELNDLGKYPELKQYRSTVPTYAVLMKARQHYAELSKNESLRNAKAIAQTGTPPDSLISFIVNTELNGINKSSNDTMIASNSDLAALQTYYGLKGTGKIDSASKQLLARQPEEVIKTIDANLERIRWMGKDMEMDYIIVDIPMMELFLRRGGKNVMHMNVVVGKPARKTPSLNSNMQHVVFNPPWGVPPTILKQDVLPGLERSGQAYLDRKDLKVYDNKGNQVDASRVNASNYKQFVFKQPPGDDNALGYVKFNLPNRWNIYLHDTPHREDFDKPDRAKSSGCIRVQQPQEMAMYILNEMNGRSFDQSRVDSIISTQQTKFEKLKNPVPVHIVYLTVFENDNNEVRFLRDIYKRDKEVIDLLYKNTDITIAKK